MSKHEAELMDRLVRGADAATRQWFLRRVENDRLEWRDLSLLETKFIKHVAVWREIQQAVDRANLD
jgi:hypothetical protein